MEGWKYGRRKAGTLGLTRILYPTPLEEGAISFKLMRREVGWVQCDAILDPVGGWQQGPVRTTTV